MTSAHSNPTKNPFIIAMALGASLFLLLQLVANRFLPRGGSSLIPGGAMSSSLSNMPPSRVQRTAYEMPVDLFNDEFFSSPFMIDSELIELKREMDRQVEQLLGGDASSTSLLRRDKETTFWKGFDIQEDDEKVQVKVSVPKGIQKDDITIEVIDGSVMHIFGSRKDDTKKDGSTFMQFDKRFALGRNMEQDKIAAEIKNGVLTVTTPKAGKRLKKKEVRKIPIKVEL